MKLPDLVDLASGNLRSSLLRNGLTTVGISVGIASLVALLSLGVGLQELAGQRLSRSGLFNTVAVSTWRDARQMARRDAPLVLEDRKDPRTLDEAARREIGQLAYVTDVEPELRFVAEIRGQERSTITRVGGLPLSARNDEAFDTLRGRFFSGPQAAEAVVQLEFAREWNESDPYSILDQEVVMRYAERQPLPADSAEEDPGGGLEFGGLRDTPENARPENDQNDGNDRDDDAYGFSVVRRQQPLRVVGPR